MAVLGRPPRAPKIERCCEVCGTTWLSHQWEKSKTRFCSRECWQKSRVGVPRGPYRVRIEKTCSNCGTVFLAGGTNGAKRNSRFCSVPCAVQGRWKDKPGHQPPRVMTPEETAWFAGIFDGEGCIAWPRKANLTSVRLAITNTSLPLLRRVEEVVGTGRTYDRSAFRKSAKHNMVWVWQCHAKNAKMVLKQIYPWLIVKKEAAEVALGMTDATEPPLSSRTKATIAAAATDDAFTINVTFS